MNSKRLTTASAPGKIILAGEHAVVYGRPAIAIPVWQVTATATVEDTASSGIRLLAPQIDLDAPLSKLPSDNALAVVTRLALAEIGQHDRRGHDPDWTVRVHSDIPIASGLGSGAAICAALVRAVFEHADHSHDTADVSSLVFESEKLFHGTPSGIDNTVIAYGEPVWFVKGQPPERFVPGGAFTFVIADSGIRAPTVETVGDVRRAWEREPATVEKVFDEIAALVVVVRMALQTGDASSLGWLFDRNQRLLRDLGVSSEPLEALIDAAMSAGALGAKLSGGGRGGNVIALVEAGQAEKVSNALLGTGANRALVTQLNP